MKQTNLKMIKEISKLLFNAVPIVKNSMFGFFVQHPFVRETLVAVPKGTDLKSYEYAVHRELDSWVEDHERGSKIHTEYVKELLDYHLKNNLIDVTIPEGAEIFKKYIFNLIEHSKYLIDILVLINKPWYMTFIKYAEPYLSDDDLGAILGQCWVEQEFPNRDNNADLKEIIKWFKRSTKKQLMDDRELDTYSNLIDSKDGKINLTVYRGISGKGSPKGLSWTTDYDKAEWFSKRLCSDYKTSKIYKMVITDPDCILSCFLGRKESEIVVDITKCHNWEVIK